MFFSNETFAAPETMFWGGAKEGVKRKTVRKPAGQSDQKKADKKSRAVSKQLERKRPDGGPDEEDESYQKLYKQESRLTLAEVASDADASAVHHFDATQGDDDAGAFAGSFDDDAFWENVSPDQIEDATQGDAGSFGGDFDDDEFWGNALAASPDLDNPPDQIEDAKQDAIADQAEQDAPTSHVVQPTKQDQTVSEQDFTEARKRLRESVSKPKEPDVTTSQPIPPSDPSGVELPESDEELPDAEPPQSDETAIAMPVEEVDAPVTAPSADNSVPPDVEREANLSMDVDVEELLAREEAKADEIKRSQPVAIDVDEEADQLNREENKGSIPVDLDIDVEGDREAAKIRKQEEKLRKKAESLAEKERVHRESFWSKRNFKDQEEYDLASQAVAMDIDLDENGRVKPEDIAVVTEALLQTYKSQYADLRKSLRLLKKTRAKQQDKPKELPGWHFKEGQTRIWTNPYAISAVAAYPRGEGFQSRYGPKKVFGIEQ
jgi:hypothetical protein